MRQLLLWLQAVGGVSLQEVKRRGRMERSREEEGLSGRLKTLVRLSVIGWFEHLVAGLTLLLASRSLRSSWQVLVQ